MANFSYETQLLINELEEKEKRRRISRLSQREKEDMLAFVKKIVIKYESIMDEALLVIEGQGNLNNKKKNYKDHFSVTKSELYLINAILTDNKFDSKPKIVKLSSGKRAKKYSCYRIKRIARMFYVANFVGKDCVESLITVPDVHFALVQIKNDQFGQLEKFMNIKTPHVSCA